MPYDTRTQGEGTPIDHALDAAFDALPSEIPIDDGYTRPGLTDEGQRDLLDPSPGPVHIADPVVSKPGYNGDFSFVWTHPLPPGNYEAVSVPVATVVGRRAIQQLDTGLEP